MYYLKHLGPDDYCDVNDVGRGQQEKFELGQIDDIIGNSWILFY